MSRTPDLQVQSGGIAVADEVGDTCPRVCAAPSEPLDPSRPPSSSPPPAAEWAAAPHDPIFILGISERSGTNFLFHLLCLHPDCHPGGPLWENYLTLHLDLLVRFAERTYEDLNPEWLVPETLGGSDVLLRDLGKGLIDYLHRQLRVGTSSPDAIVPSTPRRLVTKTPSVHNLPLFFRVFPDASPVILIRDGRAVVESGVQTFNLGYERAMRDWAAAGETIVRFLEDPIARRSRFLLVRYEDLFHHMERELRRIFAFLGLPPQRYDFAAARRLPVVGSSELAHDAGGGVHWRGVQRRAEFDPTRRWEHWPSARRDRFLWIGGVVLAKLGYRAEPPSTRRWWWVLRNAAQDVLSWLGRRVFPKR